LKLNIGVTLPASLLIFIFLLNDEMLMILWQSLVWRVLSPYAKNTVWRTL